jgi:hypothetical protein
VAGALSARQGGAQFDGRSLGIALELRIAAHIAHQCLRRDSAGDQVAGEVHPADHALAREFTGPGLQLARALGRQVGQQVGHGIGVGRVPAGVGEIAAHIIDAGLDPGFHFIGPQPAETLLGRTHVPADGVLHFFGDLLEHR